MAIGLIKKSLKLALTGAVFVAAGLATSAIAQNKSAQNNGEVVSQPGVSLLSFDVDQVGPILTEMKYLWQERQAPDGRPFILGNADGETIFVITPLACRGAANTDCVGMQLVSVFDDVADPATVKAFNNRYAFANLGINEEGNAYLNRYDIADYGIARGNLATIIGTFVSLAEIYNDTVVGSPEIASIHVPEQRANSNKALARSYVTDTVVITASAPSVPFINANDPRLEEANQRLQQIFSDTALPVNRAKTANPFNR